MKSFHRFILKIVSQYSGPPHNELMAAGTVGFWEAVERFNLNRNSGRLSTYAEHWIRKRVREAVKKWAKEGAAGETSRDRWLYSHPDATAEEIVAAAGGTLADAEKAIARLSGGLAPIFGCLNASMTPSHGINLIQIIFNIAETGCAT